MANNPYVNKVVYGNQTLIDISDTTATSAQILEGYTAYGADGKKITGTASEPNLQTKTKSYTPTETVQSETISPDSGYNGLESVDISVGAISPTYVGSGVDRKSSSDLTVNGATVTVPAGYYENQASKSVASGTAGTPTATKGTVSNHSISVTPSVTNTTGYISGGTKTGTAVSVSASELVSGNKSITANGTGINVANYSTVSVSVTPKLREATVTPTSTLQVLTPNSGAFVGSCTTAEHYMNSVPRQEPLNGLGVVLTAGVTYEVSGTYSLRSSMGYTKSGTISGQTQLDANMLSNVTSGEIANYISVIKLSNVSSSQTYVVFDVTSTYSEYYVSFALTIYEKVSGNYDGFSKVTIGAGANIVTKTVTNSSSSNISLAFSELGGEPKAFFVRCMAQLTRNSSYSYYYITTVRYDGTNTYGNYWRMSSGAVYEDTSHYSFTYSNGTLTVKSSGARGSVGGSFYNGKYELTYIY